MGKTRLDEKDNFINESKQLVCEYLLSNFGKSNYVVCKLDVEEQNLRLSRPNKTKLFKIFK